MNIKSSVKCCAEGRQIEGKTYLRESTEKNVHDPFLVMENHCVYNVNLSRKSI